MNERIKELADQALVVVGHTDGGYTEIKQLDKELFAKLIIRECADIAAERDALDIYEEIREHFGVE